MRKSERRAKAGKSTKLATAPVKAGGKRLTIGLAGFAKISAIEGLHLTRDMKKTLGALERTGASVAERRAAIIRKYG
jgi:hypothetical protein